MSRPRGTFILAHNSFLQKDIMIQLVKEHPPPTPLLRACACIVASHSPALLLNRAQSSGHVKWHWKIGNRLPYLTFICSLSLMHSVFNFPLHPFILSLCAHLLYFLLSLCLIASSTTLLSDISLSLLVSPSLFFLPCTPPSPLLLLWQDNLSHAEAVAIRHSKQRKIQSPSAVDGALSILQTNALLEVADVHTGHAHKPALDYCRACAMSKSVNAHFFLQWKFTFCISIRRWFSFELGKILCEWDFLYRQIDDKDMWLHGRDNRKATMKD